MRNVGIVHVWITRNEGEYGEVDYKAELEPNDFRKCGLRSYEDRPNGVGGFDMVYGHDRTIEGAVKQVADHLREIGLTGKVRLVNMN